MKVYELQAILDCYDPTADVVIATTHDRRTFILKSKNVWGLLSQKDTLLSLLR
jgi:hypothetical protein